MTPDQTTRLDLAAHRERHARPRGDRWDPFGQRLRSPAMPDYWTDRPLHDADCHRLERGPDGAYRLVHRPEPCATAPGTDCLHIGAVKVCRSCGATL